MNENKTCPWCNENPTIYVESGVKLAKCMNTACTMPSVAMTLDQWNTRADGWVSVKDRQFPDMDGPPVIVVDVDNEMEVVSPYSFRRYYYKNGITHWRPLPEPPNDKEG